MSDHQPFDTKAPPTSPSNQSNFERTDAKRSADYTDGGETPKTKPSTAAPVDPFDPANLGIPTDYASAINSAASAKPFEFRKPND